MILLIDNYDSFSYNLVQLIGEINPNIKVVRNDEYTIDEILKGGYSHIVLSPGPGYPKDAGICEDVIREVGGKIPIMGVCLGHQAICEVFGCKIEHAKELMHGKKSLVHIDNTDPIFEGLEPEIEVARYHSLIGNVSDDNEEIEVISYDLVNHEVMAVKHKTKIIYGLQFHPESVLSPKGKIILQNFLKMT